ncbi:11888_t:CDS:2, partial [Diversispora eburnea]
IYWSSLSETVDFNPRVYVEFVINYCPNLWFVSIYIKDNSLTELEVLLSNLKKLEGIEIQVDGKTDTTKLFDILCTKSPSILNYLIFVDNHCDWMVLPEMLESFFLEWGKKRKKNMLKIYFQWDIIDVENYKIIKKYNQKGVIQEYAFDFDNIFQIEEIRNRFGYYFYGAESEVTHVTSSSLRYNFAYALITIGGFISLVSFFGCYGAANEKISFLQIYVSLLFSLIVSQIEPHLILNVENYFQCCGFNSINDRVVEPCRFYDSCHEMMKDPLIYSLQTIGIVGVVLGILEVLHYSEEGIEERQALLTRGGEETRENIYQ